MIDGLPNQVPCAGMPDKLVIVPITSACYNVSLSFSRVSYAFPQRERVLLMLPGTGFIFCLNVQENGETAQEQRAEWGELFE